MTDLAPSRWSLRLLAGTDHGQRLNYEQHRATHGDLVLPARKQVHQWRTTMLDQIATAGLTGRGGGGFPTARKLQSGVNGRRRPLMVINVMEGEPAAKKDSVLACFAPHLILDGAEVLATLTHAISIAVAVARDNPAALHSLELALSERKAARHTPFDVVVVAPPGRYVAGEESALAHWLDGARAVPTFRATKPSKLTIKSRPGVIDNAETAADLALIARHGPEWFRSGGLGDACGTTLATLSGNVEEPGVFEVPLGTPLRNVIALARPQGPILGALLGGYGGTFVGPAALDAPYSQSGLRPYGSSPGAGVIVVFDGSTCGVAETARITRWMANESAGQCGPCVFGLPALASELELLANGERVSGIQERILAQLEVINGRGACAHPDGVVRLVRSAFAVFANDFQAHAQGVRCPRAGAPSVLALPENSGVIEWK